MNSITTVNPYTEEPYTYQVTEAEKIPLLVAQACQVQLRWSLLAVAARAQRLQSVAEQLRKQAPLIAKAVALDMGKPVTFAERETLRAADAVDVFCQQAEAWLAPEQDRECVRSYASVGAVGLITAWNFPISIANYGLIAALVAGNAVIWKPSEYAPRCSQMLFDLYNEALGDKYSGLIQLVLGAQEQGQAIVQSNVRIVSFTGSTAVGKNIMAQAAAGLKRVQLELGGLDAALVLPDADISAVAPGILRGCCNNSGQVCCSIKRLFVPRAMEEGIIAALLAEARSLTIGDPLQRETTFGPLVSRRQQERVHHYVQDAVTRGAQLLCGGSIHSQRRGFFYPFTLLAKVPGEALLLKEEPFGPVLPVIPYDSIEEAIDQINGVEYGLTASVWTAHPERHQQLISKLQVGLIQFNSSGSPAPGVPWGGIKASGIGRMRCREGVHEMCDLKVAVNPSA